MSGMSGMNMSNMNTSTGLNTVNTTKTTINFSPSGTNPIFNLTYYVMAPTTGAITDQTS